MGFSRAAPRELPTVPYMRRSPAEEDKKCPTYPADDILPLSMCEWAIAQMLLLQAQEQATACNVEERSAEKAATVVADVDLRAGGVSGGGGEGRAGVPAEVAAKATAARHLSNKQVAHLQVRE